MNAQDFLMLSDDLGKAIVYMRTVPEAHENGTTEDELLVSLWDAHKMCKKYARVLAEEGG